MSLKAELEVWASALEAYDAEKFDEALELFSSIGESSKILTNMGLIYATVGDHETAVRHFHLATEADQYLAVAYFQCGVSHFLLGRFDLAVKDFEDSLLYLRGNQAINYEQLGLKFKLYSAEVLFNKGLAQIYLGKYDAGLADLVEASADKVIAEHAVIDEAIQDRGEGYTVFSIPVGVVYRPSESKLRNTKQKDYLGKAKLVATADENEAYTTFTGVTRLKQGVTPKGTFIPENEVDSAESGVQLSRSVTVPAPSNVDQINPVPLKRSKTTINVPVNRNQGSGSETSRQTPPLPTSLPKPQRSMTDGGRRLGIQQDLATPTRGLSLRAPRGRVSPEQKSPPPRERMTDFYDDYLDAYRDQAPGLPRRSNTIATWARNNANPETPPPPPLRSPSTRPPPPSSYSGASGVRRRGTAVGRQRSVARRKTTYEEEEEGYGSGDYEDVTSYADLSKIRVKVRFKDEIRGLALTPDVHFVDFMGMLSSKFGIPARRLDVKFKDEDGGHVSLKDEMDYEMALETAKESANGKGEGKLEIWCAET